MPTIFWHPKTFFGASQILSQIFWKNSQNKKAAEKPKYSLEFQK